MFSEDQGFFGLWKGSGSRLMFLVVEDVGALAHVFRGLSVFWVLAHVFRGPKVLYPGSRFQRPTILGLWLMCSEDQRFWILAHVFRDLGFLDLGSCFQRTKGFFGFGKVLDPGSCFLCPRILGLWLMFSET